MQQSFDKEITKRIQYLVGDDHYLAKLSEVSAKDPFDEEICEFLNDVSRIIMKNPAAKAYPDVITFAFWIRKGSMNHLKERFLKEDGNVRLGRGVAFHIAPSNVPVNFAYSLVSGLLTGNANVVRVPSKEFEQIGIIAEAMKEAFLKYEAVRPYIVLVRYGRDAQVNDLLSGMADTRIVWGGDGTIEELRKSPLPPRSTEITFADRYSLAVIDSDVYMSQDKPERIAEDFYNDTYLSDQNACTSPRIVIWTGNQIGEAKARFWSALHLLVKRKYVFRDIQGVNKLTSSYLVSSALPGTIIEPHEDNLLIRAKVPQITENLMDLKDNSGYFLEYDCEDMLEIRSLCNNKRCQTISYIGNKDMFAPLLASGIKGVDRIVPVGQTMDFDLIWDGYDLMSQLTRVLYIT